MSQLFPLLLSFTSSLVIKWGKNIPMLCFSHFLLCWFLHHPITKRRKSKPAIAGHAFSDDPLKGSHETLKSVLDVRHRTFGFFEACCKLFTGLFTWFINVLNTRIQVYSPESLTLVYWVQFVETKDECICVPLFLYQNYQTVYLTHL